MKILATGFKGLEKIHESEIKEKIKAKILESREGKVVFEANIKNVYKALISLLTINRLYWVLIEREINELEKIYEVVKNFDFSFIDKSKKFAVKSVRKGFHDFTSLDVNRVIGKAIIDSYYNSFHKKLKVDLENPDIIFKAYLIDNFFRLTINITGESLHKRGYRSVKHPAPLKPTLAACLVRIAKIKDKEKILDPFCGTGTILFESYFHLSNSNPNIKRNFAISKLNFFDESLFEKIKEKQLRKIKEIKALFFGSDINKLYIRGVKKAKEKLKAKKVFCFVSNALDLNFEKININHLISNPPYGIKFRTKEKRLAKKFLKLVKNKDFKKTLIIPSLSWRKIIEKEFEIEKKFVVEYGSFTNFIFVFK